MFLRPLLRRSALVMQFRDALIAAVSQQLKALVQLQVAAFVKSKIMDGAAAMCRADYLPGLPVNHDLAFSRTWKGLNYSLSRTRFRSIRLRSRKSGARRERVGALKPGEFFSEITRGKSACAG